MLGALLVYNVQYLAAGGTAYISCVQYLAAGGTAILCTILSCWRDCLYVLCTILSCCISCIMYCKVCNVVLADNKISLQIVNLPIDPQAMRV